MWIKKPQKSDFRFRWSFYIVLLAAAMFLAARVALFESFRPVFEGLTKPEIWSAFLNGFRFDFSVIALFLGPLIFLLNLPVNSRRWAKWLLYIIAGVMLVLAGVLVAASGFVDGVCGRVLFYPLENYHALCPTVRFPAGRGRQTVADYSADCFGCARAFGARKILRGGRCV